MDKAIDFQPADVNDGAALADLYWTTMRETLELSGRANAHRERDHFLSTFSPEHACHVTANGQRVGCVVVKPHALGLLLEHLWIELGQQNKGWGSAVLAKIFAFADAADQSIHATLTADTPAHRFFIRHGFVLMQQADAQWHYVRPGRSERGT